MADIRIMSLIEPYFANDPDAVAIIGADGQELTYRQINHTVTAMSDFLCSRGIRTNQRVAVVSPSGIEMALAYLAISNIASMVPLSPDYSEEQYRYYFKLLKTDFLVIPKGYDSYLSKIADDMNMTVFYMQKQVQNEEVIYQLAGGKVENTADYIVAKDEDTAIVLFTSGTTSEPKIVPRSHRNIYYATQKKVLEMEVTAKDRVLFASPTFRGITLNDTLAVLATGGSLVYTERVDSQKLMELMHKTQPTWLAGSPVVFHVLAEYCESHGIKYNNKSLHLIRSSGAPLSEDMAKRLGDIFEVPVYIGYGLTETGNIASSQHSPKGLKLGSVGVPSGIEIAIMDESGEILGSNHTGEIVVRGPQVIARYDNDEQVNKESFHGQWFKTGDGGYLDEDGYLFITGRFKEIINRGGEKVSPYEVEEAIIRHPDILQCAVFPVPDAEGSEDVGAAVVLTEGSSLYLKDLRRFLNGKTAAFKMPAILYIMDEMPVSDAGKVQRKTLYEKIKAANLVPQPETDESEVLLLPRNQTEAELYKIFQKILPIKGISVTDSFFELGGNSLRAAALFEEIRMSFNQQIPFAYIFRSGTIEKLAEYIDAGYASKNIHPFAVPFQEEGSKTPLFFVHAAEGEPVVFRYIASNFDPDRPFYSFNFNINAGKWEHPITFEQIARYYISDIRSIQPQGPYILAGQCIGGIIAYEMACQLHEEKQEIGLLALFDSIIPGTEGVNNFKEKLNRNISEIKKYGFKNISKYFSLKYYDYRIRFYKYLYKKSPFFLKKMVFRFMDKEIILRYARSAYKINKYDGNIIYFKPENNSRNHSDKSIDIWSKSAANIRIIPLKGNHNSVFHEENAENTKAVLYNVLENIP